MLNHLLDNLNDHNTTVRKEAIRQAHNLTPEQLLKLFEMETQRSHRKRFAGARSLELMPVAASFCAAFMQLRNVHSLDLLWVPMVLPSLAICFTLPPLLRQRHRPTQARKSLAAVLADMEDPRFLGPILTILSEFYCKQEDLELSWKPDLEAALKRILPHVRPEQASTLTERQKSTLLLLLSMPYVDVDLTVCLLHALGEFGDNRAIPIVSKLAASNAITPKTRRVRDAARICLDQIRMRLEVARQSQTLLRPSCMDQEPPEELLRPVATYHSTPQEQLLRAVRHEEN